MAIPVECPACEHEFSVPDEYAGKKGKCPQCRNIFQAPTKSEARKQQAAPEPTAPVATSSAAKQTTSGLKIPAPKRLADRVPEAERISEPDSAAPPPPQPLDGEPIQAVPPLGNFEPHSGSPDEALPSVSTFREPAANTDGGPKHVARRPSKAPLWIALCLLFLGLLGGGGAFALVALSSGDEDEKSVAEEKSEDKTKAEDKTSAVADEDDPAEKTDDDKAVDPPQLLSAEQLTELLSTACRSMYSIRAINDAGERYGVGFLVDERGWIVTSYRLIEGTRLLGVVRITLENGTPTLGDIVTPGPKDGLVRVDPQHDLAILSFEALAGGEQEVLKLSSVPTLLPGEPLASWREFGLHASAAVGMTSNSEMPDSTKRVLRERRFDETQDLVWIEHSLPAVADDAGAPLFNAAGEVAGINVDFAGGIHGYAIPAIHVVQLLASISDAPDPGNPDVVGPTDPDPMPGDDEPEDKPEPGSLASVNYIRKIHEEVKAMQWRAASNDEYAKLQNLVDYVIAAQRADENTKLAEGDQVIITFAAEEVMNDLNERAWPSDTEIAEFNALAVAGLEAPGGPLMAYAEVALTSRQTKPHNDVPTVAFKLIGTDKYVTLPVSENARALTKGSRWLLIAHHDDSVADLTVEIGFPTKKEYAAALIRAKYVLGQPKEL